MPRPRILFAAASLALLAACGAREAAAPAYDTAKVTRGDLEVTVEASGSIEPVATVEVKSKASGIVKSISVDQGPTARRFMPRAMGRATPIHKKTSHVHVVLSDESTQKKVKN